MGPLTVPEPSPRPSNFSPPCPCPPHTTHSALVGFNFGFLGLLVLASLYQATHGADEEHSMPSRSLRRHALTEDDHPLMEDASGGVVELEGEHGRSRF